MKKAVVSGSHGFIGTHLCAALQQSYVVIPIPQNLLYSPLELRKFFEYHRPDLIFHLAAYGNMANQTHSSACINANILTTWNMLRESSNIDYQAFLQIGTSSEYGKKEAPMTEEDVLKPETFYAASKAAASLLSTVFAKQYHKPVVVVRPFSVYGPGEKETRFIPTMIRCLKEDRVFQLDAAGVHDWIYIDDFIRALLVIVDHAKELDVINVGSGMMHANLDLVTVLEKISGKQAQYVFSPNIRPHDTQVWVSANTKLTQLGCIPRTIFEGLQQTWDSYDQE